MRYVGMGLLAFALVSCATVEPPTVPLVDQQALADAQDAARRQAIAEELRQGPIVRPEPRLAMVPTVGSDEPPLKNPRPTIQQANERALVTPQKAWFDRGVLYFPYRDGAWYQVHTSIMQPTTFAFDGDELLMKYIGLEGGERWTVHQSDVENQGKKASILVVIPNEPNLKGGLTLVTSRTFYHLQLISQEAPGVLEVRWRHPEVKAVPKLSYTRGALRVGYTIEATQGHPGWFPVQVWDDGLQGHTLIEFPPEIEVSHAPLVYVPNAAGDLEQVNFRKLGRYYVVDVITPRLELRIGLDKAAEVVRITRNERYRAVHCPGAAGCPSGEIPL